MNTKRCPWLGDKAPQIYIDYHDNEWGKAVHDDQKLFEMLILEGAQAGLSWLTVLQKREGYRAVFDNFDIIKCSQYSDQFLEECRTDERIIRNRLKILSVRTNALAFIEVQKEFGSFDTYLWQFVGFETVVNRFENLNDYPTSTNLSDRIAKDLKKRGFKFVGTTIIYAYLQAVGVVDDHSTQCYKGQ